MTSDKYPSLTVRLPDKYKEIDFLLWISLILLIVGIFSPIMTTTQWWIIKKSFSIYTGLIDLFSRNEFFLFFIIIIFSVIFPISKILLLSAIWHLNFKSQNLKIMMLNYLNILSKWSMLDVFIVAILVVMVKIGSFADVQVRWGIYPFAISVLLSMFISYRLNEIVKGEK